MDTCDKAFVCEVATLLSLRCAQDEEEAWIDLNVDDLRIILNRGGITYMIQLIQNLKFEGVITEELFIKERLQKYSEFLVGDWLSSLEHVCFVLFPNTNLKCSGFSMQECCNRTFRNLTTGFTTEIYEFDTSQIPNNSYFKNLKNFYLSTNQTGLYLEEYIIKELKVITKNVPSLQPYIRELTRDFSKFILKWSNSENCRLTKQDIIGKLTELFLSKYQMKLGQRRYCCRESPKNKLWGQIILNKTLVVVDFGDNIPTFLNEYLRSCVRKYSKESVVSWKDVVSVQNINLLYEEFEDLQPKLAKIVDDFNKITFGDISKCLWLHKQLPVLLEVKTMQDYNEILNILRFSNYPYNVVILNKSAEELPFVAIQQSGNPFYTLEDLDDTDKEIVLKQCVKLQGRPSVMLKTLIDESMFHYIKCKDIINIFLDNFNIGTELKLLPEYFIEPTISNVFLRIDVLNKVQDELFLIEETSENQLSSCTVTTPNICKLDDISMDRLAEYAIITSIESFTKCQITYLNNSTRRTIHLLSVHDVEHLQWKATYGSVNKIKDFQAEIEDRGKNTLPSFKSGLVIISAVSGTGKSLLLDYVSREIRPQNWVFRIDLPKHQEYYETLKYRVIRNNAAEHIGYFLDQYNEDCELTKKVYQKLLEENNIVFLLDGFDDVCNFFKQEILTIVVSLYNEDHHVWITTSPHMKSDLEDTFGTLAYPLKPFTVNEQKQFLTKYVPNENLRLQITRRFENPAFRTPDITLKLIGTALQVKLLAHIFYTDLIEKKPSRLHENFDLLSLYQNCMDTMVCRKWQDESHFLLLKGLFPVHKQMLSNLYESANLEEVPSFEHRSIAEYVAASWLSENLNSSNEKIRELVDVLILERFGAGYEFLFYVFDRLLAKHCPVHLALINRQTGKAAIMIASEPALLSATDEGGRTILHLAALCGIQYPFLFKNENNFQSFESQTFLKSQNFNFDMMLKIIKKVPKNSPLFTKKDVLGYTPLDYALANRSFTIAQVILANACSSAVINIELHYTLKRDYLGYCAILNYKLLLNFLLSYFATRDLLAGKIYLLTPVYNYIQVVYKHFQVDEKISNYKINFKERNVLDLLKTHKAKRYSGWVDNFYTDLRYAVSFGSVSNVSTILNNGSDVNKKYVNGETPLHYAVFHARPAVVDVLLFNGASVNATNAIGNTPLHELVKYSDNDNRRMVDCLNLLISHGANVNKPSQFGRSAFHIASSLGNVQTLNALLSKPVDVNKPDTDGRTPLFYAAWNNRLDAVQLLIANGADVNAQSRGGWTALHKAAYYGFDQIAAEILSKTDDINKGNNNGDSALSIAVTEEELDIIELLISNGADINHQNKKGQTALHIAARLGHNDTIILLISKGADIEKSDANGVTSFLETVLNGKIDTMQLLISNGAEINAKRNDGKTALHTSCSFGYNHILTELLLHGIGLDDQDNIGRTALFCAIQENQMETAKVLIDAGANINLPDKNGSTALHVAAGWGRSKILPHLLEKVDDLNKQDGNGETVLFHAVFSGKLDMVKLLIYEGVDVSIENKNSGTVLHAAAIIDNKDILNEILSKNIDVNKEDISGNTALYFAASKNRTDNIKLLLSAGAEVNIENKFGRTALHAAARCSSEDILKEILSKSVEIDKQDEHGNTALFYAVQHNNINNVQLLISANASVNLRNKTGKTVFHFARKNNSGDIMRLILMKWISNPIFLTTICS